MVRFYILFFLIIAFTTNVCSQNIIRDTSFVIEQGDKKEYVKMRGSLDLHIDPTFRPIKKIVIANGGNSVISAPRLIFNGQKNWYTPENIIKESIWKAQSQKDTLLGIWQFVRNHRIHYYPASWNGFDPYKLLVVYGYGTCDVATRCVVELARQIWDTNHISCMFPHHVIAEINTGMQKIVLDSDIEAFYLDYDNHSLLGINRLITDKYLIYRTSQYGKAGGTHTWIPLIFSNLQVFDYKYPYSSNFDFNLKPSESIEFCYDTARKYYQNWNGVDTIPKEILETTVSNSKYILSVDFCNYHEKIFDGCQGFSITDSGLLVMQDSAYFDYSLSLPFPILDIQIELFFAKTDTACEVIGLLSLDQKENYQEFWRKKALEPNNKISLETYLPYPLAHSGVHPTYNYNIKLLFVKKDTSPSVIYVDSLRIENLFQVSKLFLPQFQLGENMLHYTDSNDDDSDRDVHIMVEWQESTNNTPPNKVHTSVFPIHEQSVDSLYFAFLWETPTDNDGDSIVDYEFMLSNDERMLFPLSPNFNRYTSSFNQSVRPYFKVKETGWLNDGQTYYWRVRAKDVQGAWSEWSDTWSFTAHGLMRPVNPSISVDHDKQVMRLSWEDNPQGKQAEFYKIYATNESNGFYPESDVVVATTQIKEYCVPFEASSAPLSFYRVTACDSSGQESLCSDVAELPYPRIYSYRDSLRDGAIFEWDVAANTRFYPYFLYEPCTTWFEPSVSILDMPEGFEYDLGLLKCTDTLMARKLLFTPESKRTVRFQMDDHEGGLGEQEFVMWSAAENRIPELQISHNEGCENSQFSAFIASIDGDVQLGDSHHYSLVQLPSWMEYRISNDTIHLFGIASLENAEDTLIEVQVEDSKSATETFRTAIRIWPSIQIESQNIDTAYEDQIWHYRPFLKHLEENSDISVSIQKKPQWIINKGLNFFGVLSKEGLTDTILEYSITDAHCQDTQRISIPVKPINHAPVVLAPFRTFVWEDSLFQEPLRYWDSDSSHQDQELRFEIVPSGLWLNVDSIDGLLSGMPQRKDSLDTRFCVHIKDIEQDSGSVCFELTILRPNLMTLLRIDTLIQLDSIFFFDTLVRMDTLWSADTLLIRDTLIHIDTIYRYDTLSMDTLWKIDTLLIQDTLIYTDTLLRVDTLVQRDSILITNTITDTLIRVDTLWRSDTLYVTDTIIKTDTLYFFDTIYLHDTILVQIRPQQTSQNQYTLYQNDSNGKVQVEAVIQNSVSVHYAIYTLHGQRLFLSGSRRLGSGTEYIPIDMGSYPSGIYILSLFEDGLPCFHVKISKTQ